jgi:hypothetical protein
VSNNLLAAVGAQPPVLRSSSPRLPALIPARTAARIDPNITLRYE